MQKKFVSSLLLLLFLNVLVKPFWIFGIDLAVQNRVGATEYGLYAAIFSFSIIFNMLLDFGLTHYNNRTIAQSPEKVAQNFSKLTSLKLFLGLLYFAVSIGIGSFLGYTHQAFWLLLTLSSCQFLASMLLFLRSHLAGLHLFKSDAFLSVLDKILVIALCALLLFTSVLNRDFTVLDFALAQLISFVLAVVVGFVMVWQKAQGFKFQFSVSEFFVTLKKSAPYALLILLMALYIRVDSVMLEQISGAFYTGVYAQAYRLLDVVNQLGYLFAVLLLPMFSGMFARNENVKPLTQLSFGLIYSGAMAIACASFFVAEPFLDLLYTSHARLSASVFKWLMVSSLFFGSTYVFGTLLTARGNLKQLNMVALAGFLVNVVLNFILIPEYQAEGAAIATVITQFTTALAQLLVSFKLLQFNFGRRYWLQWLGFTICSLLASWVLSLTSLPWVLFGILCMLVILLLALLFNMINTASLLRIIRLRLSSQ